MTFEVEDLAKETPAQNENSNSLDKILLQTKEKLNNLDIKVKNQSENSESLSKDLLQSQEELIELDGRRKFFELRNTWSKWLIAWISIFILFHTIITVSVGFGWMDFQNYKWLINAMLIENFLQVVGMGFIVIKFLFRSSLPK